MITKNSTGSNISTNMINLIGGNARTFKARFIVNNSELSCDIISLSVTKGIGENLSPGKVFIPYMEATIANCSTSLQGVDLTLQIGATFNGSDEWIPIGKFTVAEVRDAQGEIELTAVGLLNSKCGGDVTIAAGVTVANAISAINAVTGLSVTYSGITISGTITTGYTKPAREWYGIIAGMFDGSVTESNNGGIVMFKPMSGTALAVSDERCVDPPEIAESNVTEESYTFRPGIMPMTLGDPRLEPWDSLTATIGEGSYTMPCQNILHTFDGGFQTTIDCSRELPQAEIIKGPIEVKLDGVEVVADEALEAAKDTNKYFWFTSAEGAHITEIPQETFVSNPSGGNVLIDSDSVDIRQGTDVLATFGSATRIGKSGAENVTINNTGVTVNTTNMSNAVRLSARDVGDEGYGEIYFANSSLSNLTGYTDEYSTSTYVEAHSTDTDNIGEAKLIADNSIDSTMSYVTASSSGGIELSAQNYGSSEASSFIIMSPNSIYADSESITVHGEPTIVSYQSNVHAFLYAEKDGTSAKVAFGIGNNGGRHGIYSNSQGMWIIMCDEDTGDIYIGGTSASNKITGWIRESDTNNDWTYRKYSDGTFDAWGTFTVTPSSSTASGNIYYSNAISVNLPFTVTDAIVTGSVGSQYAWIVNTSSATTTVSFRIARGTAISTSTALSVRLHVFGSY